MRRSLISGIILAAAIAFAMPLRAQSIDAVPETGSANAGTASTPIANVAANDTVNGAPATLGTSGNATIAQVGTWPTGIALDPTAGAISTTASVPVGVYNLQYQLCDLNAPPDCASTTDTITVTASIVAVADSGSAVAGTASTPIANVAANDTVNGAPATLGTSGNATIAQVGTWPTGIALDPTAGAISTTASVPVGVYNLQYQLCDLNAPPDCASTTDTVTVTASILAVADSGSAVAGTASTPIANVAANDTVNGAPATLGPSGNATVSQVGTWPTGIALDPTAGAISTTASVPAGTYNVQYQLCDLNATPDCDSTTDTVTVSAVTASIVAVPDTGTADAGIASKPIANVAANDTVNGAQATLGTSGNATVAKVGTWPTGIALNTTTGAITTTLAVPAGSYNVQYQLCDKISPPDCATATDTVTVVTASIVPVADSGTADAGTASKPIANVAANDTVNGAPATLGASGNATVAKVGTWPTGIALNTTTGAITTTLAVPAGTYTVQYQLCDKNSPPACATATDTVTVITASIVAVADTGSAVAGTASKPIANVAANDTVNGAPATLGASGNAAVAKVGTWPTGLALTPLTGAVSTTITVPTGTYNVQYQLCDKNSPPACATVTDTVTITAASIVPVADTGTADAGTASKPIANVAANDTVNGAPATLGASGNATVAQVSTWPTGIALTPLTGAVSTTVAVPAGIYSITYQLCDRNVPATCGLAMDTVTVITPSIVPVADSGIAIAGTASKPIANVAANDSVNGAPATLGTSGNATVAQSGTWPTGIALTPSTGAVTTTIVVPPGIFNLQYQLCDRNTPPACGTGTATVTVAASIVALPVAGTTVAGTAATVIPNVAVNDRVNGAPATLGTSGNATVAQIGTWPTGIALNTTTGAITTTAAVLAATYSLQLQLCDKNSPPDCAAATATVTVTQQYAEVQATATPLGDLEFDWGRDGINCPTCNFGDGNARANWTDRAGNLWIAHLDPNSGQFISAGANDELADTTAFFWNVYGNGPEWTFSMQNGQVVSQLVYSRWQPGQPQTLGFTGAAYATQTAFNKWSAKFLPGAIGQGNGNPGTNNSNLPEGSQCNADPVALAMFKNFASPLQMFTEPVTSVTGTAPTLTPITMSNGIGERFVPCTHQLLFQGNAPPDAQGHIFQQVWWYNMDTQAPPTQLTTDASTKYAGFMFKAPDFGDNYIFFTLVNHTTIQVYEQTGTNPDGSPAFALVNLILSPDANEPYMNSPEPFINCTPTCTTYIFTTLAKTSDAQNGVTEPNGLAVIALSPNTPMFNILVPANSLPARQRLDPEYFITPNGPYLYYNRIVPQSGSTTYMNTGEWYIDMQLGTPSGPCRGSSAEGGLVPGC